jgi:hypothetical protein
MIGVGARIRPTTMATIFALVLSSTSAVSQTIESAYTDLALDKCRHTSGRDVEDYGFWRCEGFAGIPIRVSAGDQRTYVSYGNKAVDEPAAGQTFPGFNSVDNTKIEWRVDTGPNGKAPPFASIVRWRVKLDQDNKASRGRVLVVTRLGGQVCHVGYVDALANQNANALAREIADEHARSFDCENGKRIILGRRGPSVVGIAAEIERAASGKSDGARKAREKR